MIDELIAVRVAAKSRAEEGAQISRVSVDSRQSDLLGDSEVRVGWKRHFRMTSMGKLSRISPGPVLLVSVTCLFFANAVACAQQAEPVAAGAQAGPGTAAASFCSDEGAHGPSCAGCHGCSRSPDVSPAAPGGIFRKEMARSARFISMRGRLRTSRGYSMPHRWRSILIRNRRLKGRSFTSRRRPGFQPQLVRCRRATKPFTPLPPTIVDDQKFARRQG